MTVYPLTFTIGSFQITGYGIMMMVGFLVAGWTIQQQLREQGHSEDYAWDIVVAAVIGGIVGAKLWYVVLTRDAGALLERGGLVWYGGFIGGCAGVIINGALKKVPIRYTAQLVAPAIPIGYALGRVGCFMVQDDYGVPTSLPWGMRFPEGLPASTAFNMNSQFGVPIPEGVLPTEVLAVHPTQLYEVILMTAAFALIWRLRNRPMGTGWLFGLYLALAGLERFAIEFLRAKDDRFFGGFTLAQFTSVTLVTVGVVVIARIGRLGPVGFPRSTARPDRHPSSTTTATAVSME
jgi:phosphatidylglycerol---prolipoprotein diacylglyceryl transferase